MRRGAAGLALALLATARSLAADGRPDWLIDPSPYLAFIEVVAADARSVSLSNGLLRRTIRLAPNAATVALDNLMTGASEIRSVRPEAAVEIDGRRFDVGGLLGQEVHNYLRPDRVESLRADPAAFRFVRLETGSTRERFPWKKHPEWLSRDLPWPPPGKSLTLEFRPTEPAGLEATVLVHYARWTMASRSSRSGSRSGTGGASPFASTGSCARSSPPSRPTASWGCATPRSSPRTRGPSTSRRTSRSATG